MDVEDEARTDDQKADPHDACEHRNDKPVADVRDDLPLAPPGHAGIAGPDMLEHGEDDRERESRGDHLRDGLAEHQGDFHGQARHCRLSCELLVPPRRTPPNLREGEAGATLAAHPEPERIAAGTLRRNSLWPAANGFARSN